jgi:formin 2
MTRITVAALALFALAARADKPPRLPPSPDVGPKTERPAPPPPKYQGQDIPPPPPKRPTPPPAPGAR